MVDNRKIEIEEKLLWPKLKLYEDLGEKLLGQPLLPNSKEELVREAKRWLKNRREEIAEQICNDDRICSFRNDTNRFRSKIYLISAMCDAIASLAQGPTVVTVCVILFTEGLEELCHGFGQY